ncbi:MAG: hypothetical protein ACREAM_00475 [Blastocatellia bacterium]
MVNGERKDINAASKTSKADLLAALKESFAMCDIAFDALTDAKASDLSSHPLRFGRLGADISRGHRICLH